MFRHSWTQTRFEGEALEASLGRLARCGYDGVELPLLPTPPGDIRALLDGYRLECYSINGCFIGADRDLSSSDESLRGAAVAYVESCLQFAAAVGASVAIIVPTRIGKLRPDTSLDEEWGNVVQSLRQVGAIGARCGVTAVIECVNRSETWLANRLATAKQLVEATGSDHVRLMADNFHMNIEESDLDAALEGAAPYLRHVHLADNNRAAPGMGHFDLRRFIAALARIGYGGPLTLECDIQALDRYGRFAFSTAAADFDHYAATAIKTLRDIEASLANPADNDRGTLT